MASNPLAIHVAPDSNPENIRTLVRWYVRNANREFINNKQLKQAIESDGFASNDFVLKTAGEMGLTVKSGSNVKFSDRTLQLSQIREEAFNDLLHYVLYTGWSKEQPRHFLQSWADRQC